MVPALRAGDLLLVDHRRPPEVGDVVVARLADQTLAVKRVAERRTTRTGGAGLWLLSDDPVVGVDSRHRGVVPVGDVRAVVMARLWPRPRWGIPRV